MYPADAQCQHALPPKDDASPLGVSLGRSIKSAQVSVCKCDILQCCKVKALVMSGLNEANSNELFRDGSLAPA